MTEEVRYIIIIYFLEILHSMDELLSMILDIKVVLIQLGSNPAPFLVLVHLVKFQTNCEIVYKNLDWMLRLTVYVQQNTAFFSLCMSKQVTQNALQAGYVNVKEKMTKER